MSSPRPIISVDVTRRFRGFTLEAAFKTDSLSNAVFGPSGAGKTTLLNLIAGIEKPDSGRIEVNGRTLVDTAKGIAVPKHKRRIGLVYQDAQLFPHLTVRQNIAFAEWFAAPVPTAIGRDSVIDVLGLAHLLDRRPARLSGGEKQRVALARALLSAPELLLLDEPLASLDDARRLEILPLLERIRDEFKIPLIYVTHRSDEVIRLASWAAILREGRIVAAGKPKIVLNGGAENAPRAETMKNPR